MYIMKQSSSRLKDYCYLLPADERAVIAEAITLGNLAALRDYGTFPDIAEASIKAQAADGCGRLRESHIGARQLTNDYSDFVALYTRHYRLAYCEQRSRYQRDYSQYERDSAAFARVGMLRAYRLMKQHVTEVVERLAQAGYEVMR